MSTRIYLEFSEDLQQALADNGISLDDMLREAAIEGRTGHDTLPLPKENGVQSRDLAQVVDLLFAGSVVIASLGFTITRMLTAIYHRPIYVVYEALEELRDADGNVLLDAKGKPLFKKVPHHEILQPHQHNKEAFMADLKKMVMKFSSEDKREQKG